MENYCRKVGFLILLCLFTSCTISINLIHTSGKASDVVDEDQKADADIESQFNIPVSAI